MASRESIFTASTDWTCPSGNEATSPILRPARQHPRNLAPPRSWGPLAPRDRNRRDRLLVVIAQFHARNPGELDRRRTRDLDVATGRRGPSARHFLRAVAALDPQVHRALRRHAAAFQLKLGPPRLPD